MITFNQFSERCFIAKEGHYVLILGKCPYLEDIYFISIKSDNLCIGLAPIHKDYLKEEYNNTKFEIQRGKLHQEALVESLNDYYRLCKPGISYFTCSTNRILEIFKKSGLKLTPTIVPNNG